MSADVELDSVWIKFGDFVAARDVDITIKGGEFFSFLGPSGCGKTTLLRAVSGFLEPSQGEVRIGGQNMRGIGPNKRPTALIFQNLALFPLMTVWENIAFALEVRGESKANRRKRADELLDLIALADQGEKMVHELSGGQRQRVAIARALAAEPDVRLSRKCCCSTSRCPPSTSNCASTCAPSCALSSKGSASPSSTSPTTRARP
jgi:spermidine/putrescine transport system ATP-binding protein